MYESLKSQVAEANRELPRRGLVVYTWGNVSAIDRDAGVIGIKPSGVPYEELSKEDIVILSLDGEVVEGALRPSSDTPTHLELYRAFSAIQAIVHTHSTWATSWAQAGRPIPTLGTTHADYFYGEVPCTRQLTKKEVLEDYEGNTGRVIIERLREEHIDPETVPGILVRGHASFCWGKSSQDAVHNAVVLEQVAKMGFATVLLNPNTHEVPDYVLEKHYSRKHGKNAYYGQLRSMGT